MLARVADAAGFEAAVAHTPEEFAAAYDRARPDVVILDLALGASDGIEQIHYLKSRGYQDELVLISGVDHKVLGAAAKIARTHGLTVAGVMKKPIRMADLTALLRSIDEKPEVVTCERFMAAVRGGELRLQLQPVVAAASGGLAWAEAAVRWDHPTLGTLDVADLDEVVDRSRATVAMLTDWAVAAAVEAHDALQDAGFPVRIGFALSTRNLADATFPDAIARRLAEAGVPPSAFRLGFCETGLVREAAGAADVLARLRLKGFALSLDRYGRGGTTLSQLLAMPFCGLRIDPEIVERAFDSKESLALLRGAVGIAAALDFETTAAGITSALHVEAMRGLGISYLQGPFIGAPLDVRDFVASHAAGVR